MAKSLLNKDINHEVCFKELAKSGSEKRIFNAMTELYTLAAVVGFVNGDRKKISKSSSDPIKLVYFSDDDLAIMNMIALMEYKDSEDELFLLRKENEEEKYKLIEEYACAGMEIIKKELYDKEDYLEAIMELAENYKNPESKDPSQSILNIFFGE